MELLFSPQAIDIELQRGAETSHVPACSQGQISAYSSDSMLGVADYQGGTFIITTLSVRKALYDFSQFNQESLGWISLPNDK